MTKLSKFAQGEAGTVEEPKKVEPRKISFRGRMLVMDQSLSNTGWAWLKVDDDGVVVVATGNIQTEPIAGLTSFEESFTRAVSIFVQTLSVIETCKPHLLVHEMPAARMPRRSQNREAGIAACVAIRCAAHRYSGGLRVIMKQAQHVKKELTGDARAEKKTVSEAVRGRLPTLATRKDLRFNEHTMDAIAIGLIAAEEE
jgi:Holliday junction resolvasome RuvABC endonuclease subunit